MQNLASYIDYTLLKPEATESQIVELCAQARAWNFASVCVNPRWVKTASRELCGSDVKVCCVVGFPLGASVSAIKAAEARQAVSDGAHEIDMVLSIGDLKAGNDSYVEQDIRAVTEAVPNHPVKVIIEACLLTDEEKVRACRLAVSAGAEFVKTSTGFSKGGATVHDVALMHKTVGTSAGVKASGGIRTREEALSMIAAGASRIGTSAGEAICTPSGARSSGKS